MQISNSQLLQNNLQTHNVRLTNGYMQEVQCQTINLKKMIAQYENGIPLEDLMIFSTQENLLTSGSQAIQAQQWYVVDSRKQNLENRQLKNQVQTQKQQLEQKEQQLKNLETKLQESYEQNGKLIENHQKQIIQNEVQFKEQFNEQQQKFEEQIKILQGNESDKVQKLISQNETEIKGLNSQISTIKQQLNEKLKKNQEQESQINVLTNQITEANKKIKDLEKDSWDMIQKIKEREEYLQKYYTNELNQQISHIQELCNAQFQQFQQEIQKQLYDIYNEKEEKNNLFNTQREEKIKIENTLLIIRQEKEELQRNLTQIKINLERSNSLIETLKNDKLKLEKDLHEQQMKNVHQSKGRNESSQGMY